MATDGIPNERATYRPRAPRKNGEATWTTSGANARRTASIWRVGRPTWNCRTGTLVRPMTGKPRYVEGAGDGATMTTSWPSAASESTTRQTLVVTPFTVGRKDSVTIAIRTVCTVARQGCAQPTVGGVSSER